MRMGIAALPGAQGNSFSPHLWKTERFELGYRPSDGAGISSRTGNSWSNLGDQGFDQFKSQVALQCLLTQTHRLLKVSRSEQTQRLGVDSTDSHQTQQQQLADRSVEQ